MADEDEFRFAIGALWEKLGLGPPRFTEPGHVRLDLGTSRLDLTDNGRGSLIIEGVAATLATDEAQRATQVRKVLESTTGLLVDNDVGVHETMLPSGTPALSAYASYPYSLDNPDRLMKKIEDMVSTIEYYSDELKLMTVGGSRRGTSIFDADQAVIFKP